MPKIKISKESLQGPKRIKPGIYSLRLDGFEPEYAKSGSGSINMKPILVVVNNQEFHNRRQLEWLNTGFGSGIIDFLHCFGEEIGGTPDDPEFPDFDSDDPDPKNWKYTGKAIGRVGQVELAESVVDGKGTYINVKRWFCAKGPTCKVRHSDNLLRS